MKSYSFLILLAGFSTLSCTPSPKPSASDALPESVVFPDVRTPQEFQMGHIAHNSRKNWGYERPRGLWELDRTCFWRSLPIESRGGCKFQGTVVVGRVVITAKFCSFRSSTQGLLRT